MVTPASTSAPIRRRSVPAPTRPAGDGGLIAGLTLLRRYEGGSQPTLEVIKRFAVALSVRSDALLFNSEERGPDDELRRLADTLGVSTDYLMEGTTEEATKARLEDRKLLRQFQEIESLPEDDKLVVKKVLDVFVTKKQIQRLAG